MDSLYNIFVRSYCLREVPDEEFHALIEDIYFTEEVQSLARFPQHSTVNRLNHITAVAYMTWQLAKRFNCDCEAAARGAVLHDLFYYDWHDKSWDHRPSGYRHPGFAVINARILCGGTPGKIEENMILRHMWPLTPIPPKYKEGWLLTFADKYCANCEMLLAKEGKFYRRFRADVNLCKKKANKK